jgi:hypothetical protein
VALDSKKKNKNSRSRGGPDVNEVSFRTRPHHNVHSTLGVDTRATGPRYMEGGLYRRGWDRVGREENGHMR